MQTDRQTDNKTHIAAGPEKIQLLCLLRQIARRTQMCSDISDVRSQKNCKGLLGAQLHLNYPRFCRSCIVLSGKLSRGGWLCLPLPGSKMRMRAGFWPKVWAPVSTALVRVSSTVLLPPSCHAMSGMVSLMSVMPTLAHSSSRLMMKSCSAPPTCFS